MMAPFFKCVANYLLNVDNHWCKRSKFALIIRICIYRSRFSPTLNDNCELSDRDARTLDINDLTFFEASEQVSISPTFYECLFHAKVSSLTFWLWIFLVKEYWRKSCLWNVDEIDYSCQFLQLYMSNFGIVELCWSYWCMA